MATIDEDALLCLLGATGKETIDDILMTCFRFSRDTVPDRKIGEWRDALDTSREQIVELIPAVTLLIQKCLLTTQLPAQVLSSEFHPQLATLLGKMIKVRFEEWRALSIENQVSPAKLVDFDLRVNTTNATDQMANASSSSLLLSLDVQGVPTQKDNMPTTETIKLELSHQEVQVLLDGMLKIRDQLSAIQ